MKFIFGLSLFFSLILLSCGEQENSSTSNDIEDSVSNETKPTSTEEAQLTYEMPKMGMTLDSLKSLYPNTEFIETPARKYGIDGGGYGLEAIRDNETLFFIWFNGQEISGILLLDSHYVIDENVHVGMPLSDFIEKYPDSRSFINMYSDDECLWRQNEGFLVSVATTDSNRVADYDFTQGEGIFKKFLNTDVPIYRIFLDR